MVNDALFRMEAVNSDETVDLAEAALAGADTLYMSCSHTTVLSPMTTGTF